MHTSKASRNVSKKSSSNLTISEAKLRKLIRDELARDYLVREGFMDTFKSPFKKLGEKAKKFIADKSEEILQKLQGAMKIAGGIGEYQKFFSALEREEGGVSLESLVSSVPEYSELQKEVEEVKAVDLVTTMTGPQSKAESISYSDLRTSLILIEESYLQRQERTRSLLSESVIATVAGTWWVAVKSVVGTCGLIGFSVSSAEKICKHLGLTKTANVLKKIHHFVEHVEEIFLDKVAFPKPVQYAAYRALWAIKGGETKLKGKELQGALSMKAFMSPEGKEEREATLKVIHTAVIMVLVLQALSHILESVVDFFRVASKSASDALHAAGHAGVEIKNLANAGKSAAAAAEEITAAKSIRN